MSKVSLEAARKFLAANPDASDEEIVKAVMAETNVSEAVASGDVKTIRTESELQDKEEAKKAEGCYLTHPILGPKCKDLEQAVTVMKNPNNGGWNWIDEEAANKEIAELENAED